MKRFASDASDHDRKHGAIAESVRTDTHGSPTEREEALWCEVVRLRYRIQHLERDLTLRDELIELLRGQKPRIPPPSGIPSDYHKCGRFDCEKYIPKARLYCCQSHAARTRWEDRKRAMQQSLPSTDKKGTPS